MLTDWFNALADATGKVLAVGILVAIGFAADAFIRWNAGRLNAANTRRLFDGNMKPRERCDW